MLGKFLRFAPFLFQVEIFARALGLKDINFGFEKLLT